jgi:hypothetical protein
VDDALDALFWEAVAGCDAGDVRALAQLTDSDIRRSFVRVSESTGCVNGAKSR